MSTDPIARLAGVGRRFDGDSPRVVLSSIDFEVRPGELLALVGPSGGGKTTLLSILGGLDTAYDGRAELLGDDVKTLNDDQRSALRNETIGFVFQAFHLLEHLSVAENVALALWLLPSAIPADRARQRAVEALDSVGLAGRGEDRVGRLSGGRASARRDRAGDRQSPAAPPRRRADRQPRRPNGEPDYRYLRRHPTSGIAVVRGGHGHPRPIGGLQSRPSLAVGRRATGTGGVRCGHRSC